MFFFHERIIVTNILYGGGFRYMPYGGARPGSGRKTLPEGERKGRKPSLIISVTDEQREIIKQNAKIAGKSVSSYILDLIFKEQK